MELNVPDDYLTDLYELIWDHLKSDMSIPKADREVFFTMLGDLYAARLGQMSPEEFHEACQRLLNGDKA